MLHVLGGLIPGWAMSTFRLVSEWKKRIRLNRKVRAACKSHDEVVGKVVVL